MKLSKDLKTIYLFAIANSILLIIVFGAMPLFDTPSYFNAWKNISSGIIDEVRTPVYPCYLGIFKCLFNDNYMFAAMCIQHLIFLVSIKCFYQIANDYIPIYNVRWWATLFYSIFPCITLWNNIIMTESLSITGTIFLIYSTIKLTSGKWKYLPMFGVLLLLLVFLRPALIYILPVLGVFWFFRIFCDTKKSIPLAGLTSIVISMMFLFSYMKCFENRYGVFALSSVNTINQTVIALQYELFEPDVIENKQLKDTINSFYDTYKNDGFGYNKYSDSNRMGYRESLAGKVLNKFDLKTVNEAIVKSYLYNPIKWFKKCIARFHRSYQRDMFEDSEAYLPYFNLFLISTRLGLGLIYYLLLIESIIILFWIVRKRIIPLWSILFVVLGTCNVVVAVIGAQSNWDRLILPSFPLYILIVGQFCSFFKIDKSITLI